MAQSSIVALRTDCSPCDKSILDQGCGTSAEPKKEERWKRLRPRWREVSLSRLCGSLRRIDLPTLRPIESIGDATTRAAGEMVQSIYETAGKLGPAEWFSFGSVVVALVGACIAVFAARVEVQDDVDKFIADLTRQSKWNGIAPAVNILAGALIFMSAALSILDKAHG